MASTSTDTAVSFKKVILMMKELPILFSTPMVRPILDDRKNMSRRTRNLERISPLATEVVKSNSWPKLGDWASRQMLRDGQGQVFYEVLDIIKCPYGKVGDILWVRETFIAGFQMDDAGFVYDEDGEHISQVWYRATTPNLRWYDGTSDFPLENTPWKPSIHMPKAAARIWLQITNIRVERLQAITEADAIAEGINIFRTVLGDLASTPQYYHYLKHKWGPSPIHSFQTLWQSINGIDSWDANPWVWVIEFKVLSTTGKPKDL